MRRQAMIPPPFLLLSPRLPDCPTTIRACEPSRLSQPRVLAAACPQVINRATSRRELASPLARCAPAPFRLPQSEPVHTLPTRCHLLPNPFLLSCARLTWSHPSYCIKSRTRGRAPTLLCPAHSEPIPIPRRFPHHMTTPNSPNVD